MKKTIYSLCLLAFVIFLSQCKTSKQVTTEVVTSDSTSRHIRDSFSLVIKNKDAVHRKALQEAKNTGVKFVKPPPCPTINIDSACSKDSMVKIIRMLEARLSSATNEIKINKDGSIEAKGQLRSAYYNLDKKSNEVDSLGEKYLSMQHEFEDSLTALKKLREDTKVVSTSKPGGIFAAWWLLPLGFILGFILHWYLNKRFTLPKV